MPDTRPSALVPSVYQLRVVVRGVSPLIWRRLLIPADTTIAGLHAVLQIAFGWTGTHLHRFVVQGREYGIGYVGQRPVPKLRWNIPSAKPTITRHQSGSGVHVLHPSGLLLACDPRMERGSSGFPRGSAPRRYQRRTPEWRQALSTDPELRSRQHQSVLQSACSLISCDLVSQGRCVFRGGRRETGFSHSCSQATIHGSRGQKLCPPPPN